MITPQEIEKVRKQENLTMTEFAKRAGVNLNTAIKYSKGVIKNPRPSTLDKIVSFVRKAENKNKRKQDIPTPTIKRKNAAKIHGVENIRLVQTLKVRALIKYEVYAEVDLNVKENIISINPLKTERLYETPENVKVISMGINEGNFEITKILSEHPIKSEPQPSYTR